MNTEESTEALTVIDAQVVAPTPGALIQIALQRGTDVAQLEKLMDLQLRWEANEAHKAFVEALSAFKANPPKILKDKRVTAGQAKYTHASLANIVREVTPALAKQGLSATWRTSQSDDGQMITVSNTITHRLGHSETVTLSGPPDNSGAKNKIQQVGSTVTYLSRYTLLANLGLATEDMDDADQRKAAPMDRPEIAPRETVDWLSALAKHPDMKPELAKWLAGQLKAFGPNVPVAFVEKFKKGTAQKWLALVPEVKPDAMPDWMGDEGEQPEPPRDDRDPGERVE